jgi:D-arginine dehydrogenase
LGTEADGNNAHALLTDFANSSVAFQKLQKADVDARVPGLLPDWTIGLWQSECCDIDVAGLHAAYLRQARQWGSVLQPGVRLERADWHEEQWHLAAGTFHCTARLLVNAAGAWADEVAMIAGISPAGITPYRRTIVQLSVNPRAPDDLPLVIGLDGSFYFKPDTGGTVWLSPHDETPSAACDTAPEEMDVALAIDRFQQVVDWQIRRVEHKWAGLRSFVADRLPVIGRESENPHFFWLAGQGGFGIQTAPAVAKLAASMIVDEIDPPAKVDPVLYLPGRLR